MQKEKVFRSIKNVGLKVNFETKLGILKSCFSVNDRDVILILSEKHIFICEDLQMKQITQFVQQSFNLKFQILRAAWQNKNSPGLQIGIRFQFHCKEGWEFIDFMCSSPSVIQIWEKELEKRINQRNFHNLFKAKKKIGKGAFATVYLAERLSDGKMFAVKAFSKQRQYCSQNGKQSLQNQIKILRKVDHSNLIKLESVFQTQNSIYFILEYIEGLSLGDCLKKKHQFSSMQIQRIMYDLLNGLRHLSQNRILHRDLKPQNLILADRLVICDFGLSTFADQKKYLFVRCGTPGFVAPEIINIINMNTKSQPISDIFSAGIIFHLLLFNFSVFPGEGYTEILKQNRESSFSLNSDVYACLSKQCLSLLKSMLQKDPRKRISAQDALNHQYFSSLMIVQQIFKKNEKNKKQSSIYFKRDHSIFQQKKMYSQTIK